MTVNVLVTLLAIALVLFMPGIASADIVTGGGDMVTGLNSLVSYGYQMGRPIAVIGFMTIAVLLYFGHHGFTGLAFAVLATGIYFGADRFVGFFSGGGGGGAF